MTSDQFSDIVKESLIGEGNRGNQRKPPTSDTFSDTVTPNLIGEDNWGNQRIPSTCHKSLTKLYHIKMYKVLLAMRWNQIHITSGDRHQGST